MDAVVLVIFGEGLRGARPIDEARRRIGEAMTAMGKNQGKVARGGGPSHGRGNRAAVAGAECCEGGSISSGRSR
jgi:hypothetical protein